MSDSAKKAVSLEKKQAPSSGHPLVDVRNLKQYFTVKSGMLNKLQLKAVDGVSFTIDKGETLGLVGESGCGKTTVGRTLLHLYKPTGGEVYFDGRQVTEKNISEFRKDMQIVFQDPYSSLNPRMTVADIIGEPLDIHRLYSTKKERADRIAELLTLVGLNSEHANRYAHEFSGGQRQRIGIARALSSNPDLIICDEPISALDVSIQAQIINLLENIQAEMGISYIFIAHDLAVVKHISDRILVMYLGRVMEVATCDELYEHPLHPYTQALLSAIPVADPVVEAQREAVPIQGEVPSILKRPSGCPFHNRCPKATDRCRQETPQLHAVEGTHQVACHLY